MSIQRVLQYCFHSVQNLPENADIIAFDLHIPKENNYRFLIAEYIEELAAPFDDMLENEHNDHATLYHFEKFFINKASFNCMMAFLKDFAQKPIGEIDQECHAEGFKAFRYFIRRWANNNGGSDLMRIYEEYHKSFDQ